MAKTFAQIIFATHLRREKQFTAGLPVDTGNKLSICQQYIPPNANPDSIMEMMQKPK
jgi:hypothetical protein